jgi:DNA-binding NarL/FixJ family response regulator
METSRATPAKRRILIVDSHPLVRRGLAALIDSEPDLTVCATAASRREGLEAIATCRPDLVINDLSLVTGDGLHLLQDIRSQTGDLPVLVISTHESPLDKQRALRAGVNGYVPMTESIVILLTAIRRVLDGKPYVSPDPR